MTHLIDPATRLGVTGPWQSAAVAADSCLQANVASTAAMVLGADAPRWLAEQHLPARLIDRSGEARHIAGWPHAEDTGAWRPAQHEGSRLAPSGAGC